MKFQRHTLWLCGALTSCVVGSFDVVDRLPGAGGSATAAGAENGASDSGGSSNGANGGASAGKAPGGSSQGGSAPGGAAGDGSGALAGEASGMAGEGGAEAGPLKACDPNEDGMAPLLCDDFEGDSIDNTKWPDANGVSKVEAKGPDGSLTGVASLTATTLGSGKLFSLGLDGASTEVTVSFWVQLKGGQNETRLLSFQSRVATPIDLLTDEKLLFWTTQNMQPAPSLPGVGGLQEMQWYCVSIYLTSVHMDVQYASAQAPTEVRSFVVDDVPTSGVDDLWLQQQPEQERKIQGQPQFGSDPISPSEMFLDDVRIVNGKSNVCGF